MQQRFVAIKQIKHNDRTAKEHLPLQQGLYKDRSWPVKAKVIEREQHARSYRIETEEGNILRRNRRDRLQTKEPFLAFKLKSRFHNTPQAQQKKVFNPQPSQIKTPLKNGQSKQPDYKTQSKTRTCGKTS